MIRFECYTAGDRQDWVHLLAGGYLYKQKPKKRSDSNAALQEMDRKRCIPLAGGDLYKYKKPKKMDVICTLKCGLNLVFFCVFTISVVKIAKFGFKTTFNRFPVWSPIKMFPLEILNCKKMYMQSLLFFVCLFNNRKQYKDNRNNRNLK